MLCHYSNFPFKTIISPYFQARPNQTLRPTEAHKNTHNQTLPHLSTQPARGLTGDVGDDLGERRLAEPLGGAGSDRHQVGGSRVQAGEHVVGLVPQLGHSAARTRHVDARVRRLDALVADLETRGGGGGSRETTPFKIKCVAFTIGCSNIVSPN